MTFKDIKNKALAGYNEKVKGIKKAALTGLAGLVVGAGGASGALIKSVQYEYDSNNLNDTTLSFRIFSNSFPIDEPMGIYNYNVSLWGGNNNEGNPLGEIDNLRLRLGEDDNSNPDRKYVSLKPVLEDSEWNPSEGLYFEISSVNGPFRGPSTSFETYSGNITYEGLQSFPQTTNAMSIPEPYTLGLLGLGAVALKKSRKDKKKD